MFGVFNNDLSIQFSIPLQSVCHFVCAIKYRVERSSDQVIKPVNLEALSKWVGQIPSDVVHDMADIAPMLSVLGYDPYANPPDYGKPDAWVQDNTSKVCATNNQTAGRQHLDQPTNQPTNERTNQPTNQTNRRTGRQIERRTDIRTCRQAGITRQADSWAGSQSSRRNAHTKATRLHATAVRFPYRPPPLPFPSSHPPPLPTKPPTGSGYPQSIQHGAHPFCCRSS